ncbi:MAG: hypothetical protein AAGH38_02255 [Pseudomonadota bacterium]
MITRASREGQLIYQYLSDADGELLDLSTSAKRGVAPMTVLACKPFDHSIEKEEVFFGG